MLSLNLACVTLDQVWVYGNNFESFLVAVVVPERQGLEEWAAANNTAGGFSELCNDIKARSKKILHFFPSILHLLQNATILFFKISFTY
jgi:long-subunit acyl-CoA synthetase (AMP-forming)